MAPFPTGIFLVRAGRKGVFSCRPAAGDAVQGLTTMTTRRFACEIKKIPSSHAEERWVHGRNAWPA